MGKKLFDFITDEHEPEDIASICITCLDDEILKKIISNRPAAQCMVCGKSEFPSIDSSFLARNLRRIIQRYFKIYPDIYPGYHGLSLSDVIGKIIGCDNSNFCDIVASYLTVPQDSLGNEEEFFGEGQEYAECTFEFDSQEEEQEYLVSQWDAVALNLAHRQRYFNDDAEQFFESLFEAATTAIHNTVFGHMSATIQEHKAGLELYRARRFSNTQELEKIIAKPNIELGAPPKEVASHNRMNPIGIPLFYAAHEIATCIAEVRPSIGDDIAVGKFMTTKDLRFFDFRGLDYHIVLSKLSYFHDRYVELKRHQALLSYLHNAISQPVRHDGNGYVVTQAMAEYLCYKHKEKFDGIIFKSVQAENGSNYVIFNEKASVIDMQTPNWQPSFPVECVDKPCTYKVDSIKYGATRFTD